jgi:hypothetical protein
MFYFVPIALVGRNATNSSSSNDGDNNSGDNAIWQFLPYYELSKHTNIAQRGLHLVLYCLCFGILYQKSSPKNHWFHRSTRIFDVPLFLRTWTAPGTVFFGQLLKKTTFQYQWIYNCHYNGLCPHMDHGVTKLPNLYNRIKYRLHFLTTLAWIADKSNFLLKRGVWPRSK